MSFERIDFSPFFHSGFQLERSGLILHLALENRILELAERALLTELIETPRPVALDPPLDDEVQDSFYRLQVRLDYRDGRIADQFVESCSTDLEEAYVALQRHVTRERAANQLVRRAIEGDAAAEEAICWVSFTTGTLRSEAIKAMSVTLTAEKEKGPPSQHEVALARRHLLSKHGEHSWAELHKKLTRHWGLSEVRLTTAIERHALALRRGGAP